MAKNMSPQKKIPRHKLQILIPQEIYRDVVAIADKRNCSITIVVIQALLKRIREESKYDQ